MHGSVGSFQPAARSQPATEGYSYESAHQPPARPAGIRRPCRRRRRLRSRAVAGVGPGPGPETRVTQADQTSVAVTIYNENLALVKDRRRVTLPPGIQNLGLHRRQRPAPAGDGAPPQTTAASSGVLEQNFEFDLLTPEKLLEDSVGETVKVVRTNPVTGAETVEDARILSVANAAWC